VRVGVTLAGVVLVVPQYIADRMPHLRRRPQRARVVRVPDDPTLTADLPVDRFRDPHAQAFHRRRGNALDDQVDVVALDGEVNDAHAEAPLRARTRRRERAGEPLVAQRRQTLLDSPSHVDR
jgi:hypothetical protein